MNPHAEKQRSMRAIGTRSLFASLCTIALTSTVVYGYLECRQPNYVARDGKILALDPNSTEETEIKIRGVSWSGMEKENMIPDGLWGTDSPNSYGTQATTVKNIMEFLTNNSFNSVRLPLNADYVINNPAPQIGFIHSYENPEFTTWDDLNNVGYISLLSRIIQTFQDHRITVLLDIHLLDIYPQDALWYTAPYVEITKSGTYKAVSYLAEKLCNANYWNVLGIDLKNEMLDAQWNADAGDANIKNDWHQAAQTLADRVLELCPQWLVFVGGASSPTDFQRFHVTEDYEELSDHWAGGNLKNATLNALNVSIENKIVYAPHAHSHGVYPQNYFYSADSNCSSTNIDQYDFKSDQTETECVDFTDGSKKIKSELPCPSSTFGCDTYTHLSVSDLPAQYERVMAEALGDLKNANATMILGSFSGVYGTGQPHQTAALDFLIDFAASMQGGYFWALNPDTAYYLEDAADEKKGVFGYTHFGIMQTTSWQEPYADLVTALKRIPTSEIPCYGGKATDEDSLAMDKPGVRFIVATMVALVSILVV